MEKLKAGIEFIFSSYKRTAAILFIGALTLAIPITVSLLGQQQDIRQRAETTASKPIPCGTFGDVDGSGDITENDSTEILRFVADLPANVKYIAANADVDGNGKVDAVDALMIQRYLANLPVSGTNQITLPVCLSQTTITPTPTPTPNPNYICSSDRTKSCNPNNFKTFCSNSTTLQMCNPITNCLEPLDCSREGRICDSSTGKCSLPALTATPTQAPIGRGGALNLSWSCYFDASHNVSKTVVILSWLPKPNFTGSYRAFEITSTTTNTVYFGTRTSFQLSNLEPSKVYTFKVDAPEGTLWAGPTTSNSPSCTATPTPTPTTTGGGGGGSTGSLSISGVAFIDTDKDGQRDSSELGFANLEIGLLKGTSGAFTWRVNTDAQGRYSFSDLTSGTYMVDVVEAPSGYTLDPSRIFRVGLDSSSVTKDFALIPYAATPTPTPPPTITDGQCMLKPRGDANCDGKVNTDDFNIWRDEFLQVISSKNSDFNNDGIINTDDFNIWRDGFLDSSIPH